MIVLRYAEEITLIRLDTRPKRDGRTDGQNCYIYIFIHRNVIERTEQKVHYQYRPSAHCCTDAR